MAHFEIRGRDLHLVFSSLEKLGTVVRIGPNDVVAVYRRAPAVVVTLKAGAPYQRLIATVPEPERVADELRGALRLAAPRPAPGLSIGTCACGQLTRAVRG